MGDEIGHVKAIFRYPIKSMGGEPLESAQLGWHGIEGDRRLAWRRVNDRSGFPWLIASKLPELLLFSSVRREVANADLPSHVRTPEGTELPVFGQELAADVARRYGSPVELMHFKHGIFDDANISVIASETVGEIARLSGITADWRRFRPNIVLRATRSVAFVEEEWIGGTLLFGDGNNAPAVAVTMRDLRCSVVNVDPESAKYAPEVMKAIVHANNNQAGVYGTVIRTGEVKIGQPVFFRPPS